MNGFTKFLRLHQTDAERLLWKYLRDRRLENYKFRRQVSLGEYIVDFVCFETRLIIEVDGSQHLMQQKRDESRTRWLQSQGFTVLRFWNNEVLTQTDTLLEAIRIQLRLAPSPFPLPPGERVIRKYSPPIDFF